MASSQRRAVADALTGWRASGQGAVLATVASSDTSAPRGLGAQLAVTADDLWVGGISGGCAEVAVLEAARELLRDASSDAEHRGTQVFMEHDTLGRVGPVCGAVLGVVIERVDEALLAALQVTLHNAKAGRGSLIRRTYEVVSRSGEALDEVLELRRTGVHVEAVTGEPPPHPRRSHPRDARRPDWIHTSGDGERLVVEEFVAAAPRVVIGGAGDVATELVAVLHRIGWRSCLVDPRGRFVEQLRLHATPDDVRTEWPQEVWPALGVDGHTACVALAHDDKLDLPFLEQALASDAFYVGLIGSRLVQHQRRVQLTGSVTAEQLERLSGPAGLDLGGSSAAEIALSIAAELVAVHHGRTGGTLTTTEGPIRAR